MPEGSELSAFPVGNAVFGAATVVVVVGAATVVVVGAGTVVVVEEVAVVEETCVPFDWDLDAVDPIKEDLATAWVEELVKPEVEPDVELAGEDVDEPRWS